MRFVLLLVAMLCAWPEPGAAREVYRKRSLYRDILVEESDGQRCMRFGIHSTGRQSCMSIADPEHLVFDYTRMLLGALYINPAPQRILVIGLGGGTIPAALQTLLPTATLDCVEIDPAVADVATRFFKFQPARNTTVHFQDGRVFVKRAARQGKTYDLIILDAFDHTYVPEHLLTKEFLAEVRALLPADGIVAANTFSTSRLYDSESATYSAVFGRFFNLKSENRVILATAGSLPGEALLRRNADALEPRLRRLGTGQASLLPMFSQDVRWPAGTKVLTDQYSPANLLNGRGY
jgi:spermidine synthase